MNDSHRFAGYSRYQIQVKGCLDLSWADWFDQFEIRHLGDTTLLNGEVADQSALFGLLKKIHDLGLAILLVIALDQTDDEKTGCLASSQGAK